jgi:hypothetical protein
MASMYPLDALPPPSDNTRLNASTTAHGLLLKLSGSVSDVLRGDGTWGAYTGAPAAHAASHLSGSTDVIRPTFLEFGGTSALFPALKRSTTSILVRLADDSAYGNLVADTGTFNNTLTGTVGVSTGSGGFLAFSSRGGFYASADGEFYCLNNAGNAYGSFQVKAGSPSAPGLLIGTGAGLYQPSGNTVGIEGGSSGLAVFAANAWTLMPTWSGTAITLGPGDAGAGNSDRAGADLSIFAGQGTGSGAPGVLNFKTATVLGSGTTLQSLSTRWTIDASGHFLAGTDNSWDVGAPGATRPRSGYFGTKVLAPLYQVGSTNTGIAEFIGGIAEVNNGSAGTQRDLYLRNLLVTDSSHTGFSDFAEIAAPAAPSADTARLYAVDVAGKTALYVRFPSGAAQQIAIEP